MVHAISFPFHERFNLCEAIPHHLGLGLVISGALALVPPISQGLNGKPRHLGHFFVSEPLRSLFHMHFLQSKKGYPESSQSSINRSIPKIGTRKNQIYNNFACYLSTMFDKSRFSFSQIYFYYKCHFVFFFRYDNHTYI